MEMFDEFLIISKLNGMSWKKDRFVVDSRSLHSIITMLIYLSEKQKLPI